MQVAKEVQAESIVVEAVDYELPEAGAHAATITRVEDLGIRETSKGEKKPQVKFFFRIDDEKDSKGEEMIVNRVFNKNINSEKSYLYLFLAGLGIAPSKKVDLVELLDLKVDIVIVHNAVGTKTYANVVSASRRRTRNVATVATVATAVTEI